MIARLLRNGEQVLATGGGAYMNEETRKAIAEAGIAVWLRAELDVIFERGAAPADTPASRTPGSKGELARLLTEREPVYAQADVMVWSRDVPHDAVVLEIVEALETHLGLAPASAGADDLSQASSR